MFFYHFFVLPFVLYCFVWFAYVELYELRNEEATVKVDWVEEFDETNPRVPRLRLPAIEVCPSHQTDGSKGSFLNQVGKAPQSITPHFNQWDGCRDYRLKLRFTPGHSSIDDLHPVLKQLIDPLGLFECDEDVNACKKWQQGRGSVFAMTTNTYQDAPVFVHTTHHHSYMVFHANGCWHLGKRRHAYDSPDSGFTMTSDISFACTNISSVEKKLGPWPASKSHERPSGSRDTPISTPGYSFEKKACPAQNVVQNVVYKGLQNQRSCQELCDNDDVCAGYGLKMVTTTRQLNSLSPSPTDAPIPAPTTPTKAPTLAPTKPPTKAPTKAPTKTPTKAPTLTPTATPTPVPTISPTTDPEESCLLFYGHSFIPHLAADHVDCSNHNFYDGGVWLVTLQ